MTYDYKRLCNELLSYLYQCNWPDAERFYALVERTRAALAESEPEKHPMTERSLAAQAVLDAIKADLDLPNWDVMHRVADIAAFALRAAVDQVLPLDDDDDDPEFYPGNCCERVLKQEREETRDALLGIANSLEAQ